MKYRIVEVMESGDLKYYIQKYEKGILGSSWVPVKKWLEPLWFYYLSNAEEWIEDQKPERNFSKIVGEYEV